MGFLIEIKQISYLKNNTIDSSVSFVVFPFVFFSLNKCFLSYRGVEIMYLAR